MHCEKNISKNFLKIIFGEKDTLAMRANMQARSIRLHLHLQPLEPNQERLYILDASYGLSTKDKTKVLQVLKSLRIPSNYMLVLYKKIIKGKFNRLKLHDFHMPLQQIVPLYFKKVSSKALAETIVRLSKGFQK